MPVTTPPPDTVANAVLLLLQVPPGVALARVVVRPGHTVNVPVIGSTTGVGFTTTLWVAVAIPQGVASV
jgi:hypothetical protein